jgi:hypothetical protein
MVRAVKVTLMLAQAANDAGGLLQVIGGGWTQIGPDPAPFAIAGTMEFPWEAAGVPQKVRFDLLDDQGKPVMNGDPSGEKPIAIDGEWNVAPAPGIPRGTPLTAIIAINLPPQRFTPGSRYEWRMEVNGETHEDWRLGFAIRPDAQSKAA